MMEGQIGGDLLRGKAQKTLIGWKVALGKGTSEDDSLKDRRCRRVGACRDVGIRTGVLGCPPVELGSFATDIARGLT